VLFEGGLASLAEHQQEVDRLNVFPVPDGDTGRNMYLTMQAAVRELQTVKTDRLNAVSEALAKGSLMGARGNSGVILSQLIRGFADAVKGSEEITIAQFARAWQMAVSTAYHAVMKPVEGTMLTVARGFSQALGEVVKTESDLVKVLSFAVQKGNETLQLTPELLPVLKKAGVVDAGGKGLLFLLEGGLMELGKLRSSMQERVLTGTRPAKTDLQAEHGETAGAPTGCDGQGYSFGGAREADAYRSGAEAGGGSHEDSASQSTAEVAVLDQIDRERLLAAQVLGPVLDDDEDFIYIYCVEFLLQGDPVCVGQLRLTLPEYGGSLIIANIDDVIKIHVHSNHPGQVLEHCLQFGTLHNIQIGNMRDQWQQAHGNDPALKQDLAKTTGKTGASREIGVVAVAAGEGIESIFRSLGAGQIVAGGQTMNPPVEEFVRAIEALPNEQVLILPNNKNLIMAAEQAGKLVSRSVAILPTTSIQAGISAILSFNPSLDLTENIGKMEQAVSRIKTAEVTYSVRDAVFEDTEIKQGELIGLWRGSIVAVDASLEQVLPATIDRMLDEHDELVTLFSGQEVPPEEAGRLADLIRGSHPQIEVELQYGGQPVYFFLISVE